MDNKKVPKKHQIFTVKIVTMLRHERVNGKDTSKP